PILKVRSVLAPGEIAASPVKNSPWRARTPPAKTVAPVATLSPTNFRRVITLSILFSPSSFLIFTFLAVRSHRRRIKIRRPQNQPVPFPASGENVNLARLYRHRHANQVSCKKFHASVYSPSSCAPSPSIPLY